MKKALLFLAIFSGFARQAGADDGYRVWLKYDPVTDSRTLRAYRQQIRQQAVIGNSATCRVIRDELSLALNGLLGKNVRECRAFSTNTLIIAVRENLPETVIRRMHFPEPDVSNEGFIIQTVRLKKRLHTVITGRNERGVLYGTFAFIRLLQTYQDISNLDIASSPRILLRVLNHWDNLDRTVERGYAGFSLWDWQTLPDYMHRAYTDYARANASIGINGAVLNNVNADAWILTPLYLRKVAALADLFRPYGIRVYLSVRFSAPMEIGTLALSDPLDPHVRVWWKDKVREIYDLIPDFGGFLVKANSEGQPGPQDYGRTHAEGANMLAEALEPYHGVVMWRAFVYKAQAGEDRAKQAFHEFKPLDGKFRDNVLIQVKNGPIDFQPREPFHPLFGAMPDTPLMMEFQITQEYLGFATHLVYLGSLFKEVLESDTHVKGEGSTVAKVIDGSLFGHSFSGIAGVANTGTARNWTGHLFGQANWYVFGRLAWDHRLSAEGVAEEWIRMTLTHDPAILRQILEIMMSSRETAVRYMTPLGLHHLMGWSHHYGPAPWISDKPREDWTSVYYHRADSRGIGFDRTRSGSDAVSQYAALVCSTFSSLQSCPDELLLFFHHLDWEYTMRSGKTLWEELCERYYSGARHVSEYRRIWEGFRGKIDGAVFEHVRQLLSIQEKEAVWWRNACVLYFQTFSGLPIPEGLEKPDLPLEYYRNLFFPYAPK